MTSVRIPAPPELDHNPELAVLATLEAALMAAEFALIAIHPALRDPDRRPGDQPPDSYWIATVFLAAAAQLRGALHAYQRVIERGRCPPTSSEIPF